MAAALVASSALYGSGYVLARYIDPGAGVGMFVTQSMVFSWLTLALMVPGKLEKRPSPGAWAAMAFNGATGPFIVFLIMLGSQAVTPALSSLIVISNVLFIALFARLLGRKRFSGVQAPALVAGFAGVALISASRGGFYGETWGVAMLLMAAVMIALATISIEKPLMELGWGPVTRWTASIAAVTAVAGQAVLDGIHLHSAQQTALAAVMGVFSLGAPGILYSRGMSRLGSADSAVFKLLIPMFSLIYGAALLGELPDVGSFAAGVVVAVSLVVYHQGGVSARRIAAGAMALQKQPAPEQAV